MRPPALERSQHRPTAVGVSSRIDYGSAQNSSVRPKSRPRSRKHPELGTIGGRVGRFLGVIVQNWAHPSKVATVLLINDGTPLREPSE
jgi:hypothetical protein